MIRALLSGNIEGRLGEYEQSLMVSASGAAVVLV